MRDFAKLTVPIRRKIQLVLGRALLAAVDNSYGTQLLKVDLMADETVSRVERFQPFGFESFPVEGAEVISAFLGGNREQGIALVVHDRRYRPKDLSAGDSAQYSQWDKESGHRVHLYRSNGKLVVRVLGDVEIVDARDSRTITTPQTTHKGNYKIEGDLEVTGNVQVGGDVHADGEVGDGVRNMSGDRIIYNSHKHTGSFSGGPPDLQQ